MPFRRDKFVTGPGPASGGSKSGHVRWPQIPEKSGTAGVGAATCALAGIAAAAKVTSTRISRRFTFMDLLLWLIAFQANPRASRERARRESRLRANSHVIQVTLRQIGRRTRNL